MHRVTVYLPTWGEVWQYGCPQSPVWYSVSDRSASAHANTLDDGSATSSTFSSVEYHEHNVWNPMWHLCATLKLVLGWKRSSTKLTWEELLLRAIFRGKYCVTRHPPCQLSTITCLQEIGRLRRTYMLQLKAQTLPPFAAENEPALMRYVMDGSPWSFIIGSP